MSRTFSILMSVLVLGSACTGETATANKAEKKVSLTKKQYVKTGEFPTFQLGPSSTKEFAFEFQVQEGLHIQANPATKKNLIATALTITPTNGVTGGSPIYPKGKPFRLINGKEDFMTYDGKVTIRIPLTASPNATPGDFNLDATLRYQACDANNCFFPMNLKVSLPIKITKN